MSDAASASVSWPADGVPLTAEERRALHRRSDLWAAQIVAANLLLIAAAFALVILWRHPVAWLIAVPILGSRALGLGILTHDASHNALFTSKKANDVVGRWLTGALPNVPLKPYRRQHMQHHRLAGTADDPDLPFVVGYPAGRASMRRKIMRDMMGVTGFKNFVFLVRNFNLREQTPFLVVHALLLGTLTLLGTPWAYLAWWAGIFFIYPLVIRLRVMGEHGAVPEPLSADARLNTRSTRVNWVERLLVAPNFVNWHLEHHLMPGVPPYRLRQVNRLLTQRGYYTGFDCIASGYLDVLRRTSAALPDGGGRDGFTHLKGQRQAGFVPLN